MSFAVTGATGHLGRLIIDSLLTRGVAPQEIVAVVRDPQKARDLAGHGVNIAVAPYEDKEALTAALTGVQRLVLVSGSELGKRVAQHQNVIEAASAAGVSFIAYVSLLSADSSPLSLADEHLATEELLKNSGIHHTLLRNGWYWENFAAGIALAQATGHTFGASGAGKVSGAARKDYAEAAAIVATTEDRPVSTYELAGGVALTASQIAGVIGEVTESEVTYVNQTVDEYAQTLRDAGMPEPVADMIAGWEAWIEQGALYSERTELEELIGRPATTLAVALKEALKATQAE